MRSMTVALLALAIPTAAHADLVPRPGTVRLPVTVRVTGYSDPARQAAERDLREARRTIERRRENGELTRAQARQLRREIAIIERLSDRYARGGVTVAEARELQQRADTVEARTVASGSPRP